MTNEELAHATLIRFATLRIKIGMSQALEFAPDIESTLSMRAPSAGSGTPVLTRACRVRRSPAQ